MLNHYTRRRNYFSSSDETRGTICKAPVYGILEGSNLSSATLGIPFMHVSNIYTVCHTSKSSQHSVFCGISKYYTSHWKISNRLKDQKSQQITSYSLILWNEYFRMCLWDYSFLLLFLMTEKSKRELSNAHFICTSGGNLINIFLCCSKPCWHQ